MGTVKVTNIEPIADNGTVTLGGSGDTFTLASGVKQQLLRPTFMALSNTNQSIPNSTLTKLQFADEQWDTNSAYSTTDHRFTVPTGYAGKYFFKAHFLIQSGDDKEYYLYLYKNGSLVTYTLGKEVTGGGAGNAMASTSATLDLIVGDYIEAYGYNGTGVAKNSYSGYNIFTGFRIGD